MLVTNGQTDGRTDAERERRRKLTSRPVRIRRLRYVYATRPNNVYRKITSTSKHPPLAGSVSYPTAVLHLLTF